MGHMRWIDLANRWKDRCNLCGENDQRKVTFSICHSCRVKQIKKEEGSNK